jgi:ubiquinone/menaquinone biosynthesis C-methylase UbiE
MYDRIEAILPLRGARAIDVGTGTGTGALALARRGATVIAMDPAPNQLRAVERGAAASGVQVRTLEGKSESIDLPDASVDLYLALQCWHWFDRPRAAAEAMRVLRPGGLAVCASFDYLPHRSELARATEDLVLRHNPTWPMAGGHGVHINPMNDLPAAGFIDLNQFSYEHPQPFTHEAWRGRMRTCNGVGASLGPDVVAGFDRDLAVLLRDRFPSEPIGVAHRVWVVTARRP